MNSHYVLNSGERDVVQDTIKMIPAHKKLNKMVHTSQEAIKKLYGRFYDGEGKSMP